MNLEELERPLGGGVGARLVSLDGSEGAQPDTTQPGRHVPVASAAADADTQRPDCADEAGESVASVHRAIRRYEHAGLAGVHIEDEIDPKGLGVGPPLLPITDLQARVETAVTPTAPTSSSSSSGRTSSRWTTVAHRLTRRHDPARRRWSGRRRGRVHPDLRRRAAACCDRRRSRPSACECQSLITGLRFALFADWASRLPRTHTVTSPRTSSRAGTLPPDFGGDFDRRTLTDQTVYDDVVRRWTERTGRPTRTVPR